MPVHYVSATWWHQRRQEHRKAGATEDDYRSDCRATVKHVHELATERCYFCEGFGHWASQCVGLTHMLDALNAKVPQSGVNRGLALRIAKWIIEQVRWLYPKDFLAWAGTPEGKAILLGPGIGSVIGEGLTQWT